MPISQLDVIVPVRNEAGNISALVRRLNRTLSSLGLKFRLIFVDDRSTDRTVEILRRLSHRYPITIHSKVGKTGKAFSILEGAGLSASAYILMIDGDLQYPPEAIPAMLRLVPQHGVVVANRQVIRFSPLRRYLSRINRRLTGRWLLGIDCDIQSGLKLFRRDILKSLPAWAVTAWAFDFPLLHTALELGVSIGTVDIDFAPRNGGASKLQLLPAITQIGSTALRLKVFPSRPHILPSRSRSTMLAAGVIHKRRRFITHTTLPLDKSALLTFVPWQKWLLFAFACLAIVGLIIFPLKVAVLFVGALSILYFVDVLFHLFLVTRSLSHFQEIKFTPRQLAAVSDRKLPVYSILCPLYKEAAVLPDFLTSIGHLDWPKSKLDVILLLEEDDRDTRAAASRLHLPRYVRLVIVPHSLPKTKPKACNYGLSLAKGKFVVVYDAEDRPDPMQLKKAYLAFRSVPKNVVCLQAKLNYYNPRHNLLTRLFTAEYSLWFDLILPGLQSINTAIPLGGTSNHFRAEVLKKLHGWDAFNVTEDCDLGARLFLAGSQTAMIDSVTLEEANSHLGNWLRQRSRWIKGYIQTYFVHNRHPIRFLRSRGVHAFLFQLLMGGKILFLLINPVLWLATFSYFALYRFVGPAIESLYPPVIFYLAVFSAVFGNFLFIYYYMLGLAKRGSWDLVKYVYFIPLYWILISLAGVKAVYQLVFKPHFWEKTHHGLHLGNRPRPVLSISCRLPVWPRLPELSGGFVLVIAAALANFFNFLYNAYLGRHLSLEDFGLIGLIGSIFYLSQIPLGALSRTVTHRSAYLFGRFRTPARQFWAVWRGKSLSLALGLTVIWLIFTPVLSAYFQTTSILPLLLFTPVWLGGTLLAVDSGFLTGNLKFSVLAVMTLSEAVAKFLLAVGLHRLSNPQLVFAALPVSTLLAMTLGFLAAKSTTGKLKIIPQKVAYFPRKFFATSLVTSFSTLVFLSLDVILAKHFLPPREAGLYALLSLVGKMVFFAGSLFSQFVNPVTSHHEGAGKNSASVFYLLLSAVAASSLAAAILLGPLGFWTVPILLGSRSLLILPFLTRYCLAMAGFAVAVALVNYHQARRHYGFSLLSLGFVPLLTLGLYFFHTGLNGFTNVLLAISGLHLGTILVGHGIYGRRAELTPIVRDFWNLLFRSPMQTEAPVSGVRILIFNWRDTRHVWAGGAEVYLHELARRWVASGCQVTLFCGNDRLLPRRDTIDGVQIIRRGGFYTVYIWAFLYYIFKFRGRYDIIIDSANGVPFFTPLFSRLPKFLLIHHVHQDYFRRHVPFPINFIAAFAESKIVPAVYKNQQVITVSQSSKRDIINLGFSVSRDIRIINPGIDLDNFTRLSPKTSYPSFLYLGRIRPYKNLDIAIKAFSRVRKNFPGARLNIAGDGEGIKPLRLLCRELGLESVVYFLGRVSEREKIHLLSSSWVMLQPSSFEGWGITVIEANACGTPVIASNVIGLRDSIHDGQTGLLVPDQNVSALAASMEFLIRHSQVRSLLASQARIWSQNFGWNDIASIFLKSIINSGEIRPRSVISVRPAYVSHN